MKKSFYLVLTILVLITLLSSCKKDKGDPPVLPPKESMEIDFSNFDSKSGGAYTDFKGIENSNWALSSYIALTWNSIISITLAVPVAAFKLAVNQKPVYIEDKTWQWSYTTTVLSVTYKARLTGQIRASDVLWKMYITREGTGGYAEFLWFEGTSKLDGSSGQWKLNHSNTFQEPFLEIDWAKSGTDIGTIKYTYVRSLTDARTTDPFKTSYIEYGLTSATLNAYYKLYCYDPRYLQFYNMTVEWSTTAHNGRVKSAGYFGDDTWHCWNASLINDICP